MLSFGVVSTKNIHIYLKRLSKYYLVFQLHTCMRPYFLHILTSKQHIAIYWLWNKFENPDRELILIYYGHIDRDTDIDLDVAVVIDTATDIDKDMNQINKSSLGSSIILRGWGPKIIMSEKCDMFLFLPVLCHISLPQ